MLLKAVLTFEFSMNLITRNVSYSNRNESYCNTIYGMMDVPYIHKKLKVNLRCLHHIVGLAQARPNVYYTTVQ